VNSAHHQAIPASTESYRVATREQLHLSHVRKQCYCGKAKAITAKQLAQYGACDACHKAARTVTEGA
jgi:Zn finger protein HypA/HybF involved in hydrogenase expression